MLSGQTGETYLTFRTVSTWIVKPGELRDRQFSALTGWCQEADFAIAEIEVIELTKKQIADMAGLQAIIATTTGDGCIGAKAQLPESEVTKLPAHMQQALPDIQRQGDAFN